MGVWFNGIMAYGKITTQIDPKLHEATRLKALREGTTMRDLIEQGLRYIVRGTVDWVDPEKKPPKPVTREHSVYVGDHTMEAFDVSPPLKDSFNPQPKSSDLKTKKGKK